MCVDFLWLQRGEQLDERLEGLRARAWPALHAEDECLRFVHRHVEVLGPVPYVRRQSWRETESSHPALRLGGTRKHDDFVERQSVKRLRRDLDARPKTADDFRLDRVALARDEHDSVSRRTNRGVEARDAVGDEDV